LIERLTDREPQTPERYVIGNVGRTDGAEQDGVEPAELVGSICRHHHAVLLIVVRTPVKVLEFQLESTVALGTHIENPHAGFDDLRPDSVAAHRGNLVDLHDQVSVIAAASRPWPSSACIWRLSDGWHCPLSGARPARASGTNRASDGRRMMNLVYPGASS